MTTAPDQHSYDHPAAWPEERLLRECDFRQGRGKGPGGQHRNKVETLVMVTHVPTGVTGQAGERRVMTENRRNAIRRLRINLAMEVRRTPAAAPSPLWLSRCEAPARGNPFRKDPDPLMRELGVRLPDPEVSPTGGGRIVCNPSHDDYPALLAEALDHIAVADWSARTAALQLGVSQSQLIKLIAREPHALEHVNRERTSRGKHAYRA
ncbi:MAG: hypothetical protein KDA21_09245 [Phycisphaerales bacterium]|nr:hypothetical protein [Phycisphaerales bacterium]